MEARMRFCRLGDTPRESELRGEPHRRRVLPAGFEGAIQNMFNMQCWECRPVVTIVSLTFLLLGNTETVRVIRKGCLRSYLR